MEQLISKPEPCFFDLAAELNSPAVAYNFDGIVKTVAMLQSDISCIEGGLLSYALKACNTKAIVALIREQGVKCCDVASVNEMKLAKEMQFELITTTSPAYDLKALELFTQANIVCDFDSLSQLEYFGKNFPNSNVGVRLKIPLPKTLMTNASFGSDSRFGIDLSQESTLQSFLAILEKYKLRVIRFHVHTGQMSPEQLVFKAKLLLKLAMLFPDLSIINYGGGFFNLYAARNKARKAFEDVGSLTKAWCMQTGRKLLSLFEPGGALLNLHGYLVASVLATRTHSLGGRRQQIVTLDCSAWAMFPWSIPNIIPARKDGNKPLVPTRVAGNSLYENDWFGNKGATIPAPEFELPELEIGDRVLVSSCGAYSFTNGRRFNMLDMPFQYAISESECYQLPYS